MSLVPCLGGFAAFAMFISPCIASVEFVIDSGSPTAGAPEVSFDQAAAQEIFLPSLFIDGSSEPTDLLVTSIAPILWRRAGGGPNPVVNLQVSRVIGPETTPDETVGSYFVEVDSFTPSQESIETNLRLQPGRYFIVASSAADRENAALWQLGESIIGTKYLASQFDADHPPRGNWNFFDVVNPGDTEGYSLGVRVEGRAIPEPSTLATVVGCITCGFGCQLFRAKRRRRLEKQAVDSIGLQTD